MISKYIPFLLHLCFIWKGSIEMKWLIHVTYVTSNSSNSFMFLMKMNGLFPKALEWNSGSFQAVTAWNWPESTFPWYILNLHGKTYHLICNMPMFVIDPWGPKEGVGGGAICPPPNFFFQEFVLLVPFDVCIEVHPPLVNYGLL